MQRLSPSDLSHASDTLRPTTPSSRGPGHIRPDEDHASLDRVLARHMDGELFAKGDDTVWNDLLSSNPATSPNYESLPSSIERVCS